MPGILAVAGEKGTVQKTVSMCFSERGLYLSSSSLGISLALSICCLTMSGQ